MKTKTIVNTAAFLALISTPMLQADTFGTGVNQFTMDFTTIGSAGNSADNTGYGSMDNNYRIGTYEVSRGMIDAYNNINGSGMDTFASMYDMTSYGGNGANRPATGVSWNEAARFVNWLNTSQGYSAAYKTFGVPANFHIMLWNSSDTGYDASNPYRNSNAHYFLPSENEWYKAAYYDPNSSSYDDYATGSDTAPSAVAGGTIAGSAVYGQPFGNGPADVNQAGGLSSFGTMGQGGNVRELIESAHSGGHLVNEDRAIRGGYWASNSSKLQSSERNDIAADWETETRHIGFRVASVATVPEPSSTALLGLGGLALILRRKRD